MTPPSATELTEQAAARHLACLGAFAPDVTDAVPDGTKALLLFGPVGADWPRISATAEFTDDQPDPLDRWSRRVLGDWAAQIGGTALFPFDGPPWHPFQSWATRTGRAVQSPVGFLCHVEHGLMVSYRGALALPWWPNGLPGPAPAPCATCAGQPCRIACPVNALTPGNYDVARCRGWLDRRADPDCHTQGCAVRLSCPLSAGARRSPAQSAFHMRAFHP